MSRRDGEGMISFIGAGPGDPGLLTQRSITALSDASHVIYDATLPEPLITAAKRHAGIPEPKPVRKTKSKDDDPKRELEENPELDPSLPTFEKATPDVISSAVALANEGAHVVRLIHGAAGTSMTATAEASAASTAGAVFEVLPGVEFASGVTTFAGTPVGPVRSVLDIDEVMSVDFAPFVHAPGALVVTVPAEELGNLRNSLLSAGMDPTTPVSITGEGTTEIQSTSLSTVESMVDSALGLFGRIVLTIGEGVGMRETLGWWEQRPLYGWKALVPRTKEQAGAMSRRLREWGAIPTEVPTIAVEPPRTPAQMERAIRGLVDGRYAWVVFTSANAVRAVLEKFNEHGLDARHFGGVRIACIGEATADAVRGFGIQPELIPSGEQSSHGLLEDFPPYDKVLDPIDRILLPRADIATEILAQGLTERGWECDDVTAYRTVRASPPAAPIRDAIKTGGFDIVLFTSSSTVRNLVGIAGKPHARTVIACIGPATAETARELGLRVDVQPDNTTLQELIEASARYAVELKEKMATMTTKPRRGAKIQGPTAGRLSYR